MQKLRTATSRWGLWLLFSLPAMAMTTATFTFDDPRMTHNMVHPSGEFAVLGYALLRAVPPPLNLARH